MGLAEVLAAHTGSERGDLGAWCVKCYCGHDTSVTRFPGDAWDLYRTHVATAVLAWLETLAQDEAVELAVRRAIATRTSGHAATAAVTAFLTAAKDAS